MGSFVPRYALVNQTAIIGWAVHQDTAFLTGHVPRGRFLHGNFVFGSAAACMRSGVPLYEFGHARNMSPEQPVFQRSGLPQSNRFTDSCLNRSWLMDTPHPRGSLI
jgi:hypothetical protein